MKSPQGKGITSAPAADPSSLNSQNASFVDSYSFVCPIAELTLGSFSATLSKNALPTPSPVSTSESNHGDEVPIADGQSDTHSNVIQNSSQSCSPPLSVDDYLIDACNEDFINASDLFLLQSDEVPQLVESNFTSSRGASLGMIIGDVSTEDVKTETMRLSVVSDEVEGNRTLEALLLGETAADQQTDDGMLNKLIGVIPESNSNPLLVSEAPTGCEFVENAGVQNHNSDVSNMNLDESSQLVKANEGSAASLSKFSEKFNKQHRRATRKLSASRSSYKDKYKLKMASARRKRKKSASKRENEELHRGCCNCKNSRCLQLYCECFAGGFYCGTSCGCKACYNNVDYDTVVSGKRKQIESNNNLAFAPSVVNPTSDSPTRAMGKETGVTSSMARHKRGCACKKSMCQKKYCDCYQSKVGCTEACRCEGCLNSFGTRTEAGNRRTAERRANTAGEKTDSRGTSPGGGAGYIQEQPSSASNFSSTYACNLPLWSSHSPEAFTSNLTNGNGCPQAPTAPFPFSFVSSPLHWSRHPTVIPSPQSLGNVVSHGPSSNKLPHEMMTENKMPTPSALRTTPTNQQLASTPYFQSEGLNPIPWPDLRNTQQLILQNYPTFAPLLPYMNSNGSSAQNGDHKDFTGD